MIVVSSLLLFIVLSYGLLILFLYAGFLKLPEARVSGHYENAPFITVVIPFRNESDHLPGLIQSLIDQTYPDHLFEVIFVDDHSSDGSAQVVMELCRSRKHFSLLHSDSSHTGKKAAVQRGISKARGEFIIQTDADCILPGELIELYASRLLTTEEELIAGPVTNDCKGRSVINRLGTLDFLSLVGTGAGSFFYNNPIMCNGANLCYSKALYMEALPYDPIEKTSSGDDMFLLMAAKKLNRKTGYLKSRKAIVFTDAVNRPGKLIRQRTRWGAKAKYYKDKDIIMTALIVFIANLLIILSPLMLLVYAEFWKIILVAVGIKMTADFLLLKVVTGFMRQSSLLWWYLPASILYYPYIVYLVAASLFGNIEWKGRGD